MTLDPYECSTISVDANDVALINKLALSHGLWFRSSLISVEFIHPAEMKCNLNGNVTVRSTRWQILCECHLMNIF